MDGEKKSDERDIPLVLMGAECQAPPASGDAPSAAFKLEMKSGHMTSSNSLEPVLTSRKEDQSDANSTITLSKKRWLILLSMCTFGICATISNGTAPILGLVLELLDLREDEYIYLHQIFTYFPVVTTIPTAWYVDKYGIKRSILTAATLYAASSFLQAGLYSPTLLVSHQHRMFCWFVGGFIGAQAASICFILPLKVSETWFPAKERSIAWTLIISTAEIGICVVSLVYPRIMQTLPDIQILGYISVVGAIVTNIVCLSCISSDAPKHPPSERQARANELKVVPLKTSLKRIVTNKDVVLHLVHLAILKASAMSIHNILQKILTSAGHSTIFAGNLMSINAFVSIIMLIVMSSFVHKTENPILICKLSSAMLAISYVVYLVFLVNQMPGWSLVVISTVPTVCRSWAMPNTTNITAHLAAGLASQATIVGFSITLGMLVSNVINVTFATLIEFPKEGQERVPDYTQPLIFVALVTAINETIYQVFFQGQSRIGENNESTGNKIQKDLEKNSGKD